VPETLTTQILIDRVQAGDRAALNELCARYQERVLSAVRIRLGAKLRRKVESWDIVQEVLMGAFRHIKSGDFGTEGALMKYLNALVENRLRDEADRQNAQRHNADREISLGARSSGDGNPLMDIADRSAPGPSTLLSRMEDFERMERAMDELSPEHRELVVAVELEGRTYGELAEEGTFGKTPDAIRMKLNRALARLARLYHELEPGEDQNSRSH
jgi:RNA polymerase sigma factor (sigma-70 family)